MSTRNSQPTTKNPPQVDYRKMPNAGGRPVTGSPADYADPNPAPATHVSPQADKGIQSYDLPGESASYDQLGLGVEIPTQGWSRDLYRLTNPDVNPAGASAGRSRSSGDPLGRP